MNIHVGSLNPIKIAAVKELISNYPALANADVTGFDVDSGVAEQPKTLSECIQGAKNRAQAAHNDATYSLGVESGLMQVPETKGGYMNVCVCVIHDGADFKIGLSSAWEVPSQMQKLVFENGYDMSQAAREIGLTDSPDVGREEGVISLLTDGKLDRKAYTQEAIRAALVQIN